MDSGRGYPHRLPSHPRFRPPPPYHPYRPSIRPQFQQFQPCYFPPLHPPYPLQYNYPQPFPTPHPHCPSTTHRAHNPYLHVQSCCSSNSSPQSSTQTQQTVHLITKDSASQTTQQMLSIRPVIMLTDTSTDHDKTVFTFKHKSMSARTGQNKSNKVTEEPKDVSLRRSNRLKEEEKKK